MFENMKHYRAIVVTGPQRAGTRICAKMIAYDTGHRFIDERKIHIDSLYRFRDALTLNNVVVQAPALCRYVHNFGTNDDILFIIMKRDIKDIIASQERIKWEWEPIELLMYNRVDGVISEVKYDFWEQQKTVINHWKEIDFTSLKNHPLWVDKEERKDFAPLQTEVKNAGI